MDEILPSPKISAVNVELGIGEALQAIIDLRRETQEELRRQRDRALTVLREQLQITETVILKLEDLFLQLLRGYRTPEITGDREALKLHLDQTVTLLESRTLLPHLEHAIGAIGGAASSPRFEKDYREMVKGLQTLHRKLQAWRAALGPGGVTGPGVWRLQELRELTEQQLASASQPVNPKIADVAKEAFDRYDWSLTSEIRELIGAVTIHS